LAKPNIGLLTDMIACPGGDFCSLANARSLPIAEAITQRYQDIDELYDIGEIDLNISGCINSCGHHHAGHIGILGVDKDGKEWYQVTLGGSNGSDLSGTATPGKVVGPSFSAAEVPEVIEAVLDTYRREREAVDGRNLLRHVQARGHRTLQGGRQRGPLRRKGSRVMEQTLKIIGPDAHAAESQGVNVLQLANDADPLEVSVEGVDRIELNFPKFTDGRAYSQAMLIRRRLGFRGDLRATGDVLIDQLVQMQRTGFSSAVLRADKDVAEAKRQFERYAGYYQGDAVDAQPRFKRAA
jgi:uncharacterized protein (DUF934 family)